MSNWSFSSKNAMGKFKMEVASEIGINLKSGYNGLKIRKEPFLKLKREDNNIFSLHTIIIKNPLYLPQKLMNLQHYC